MKLDSNFCLIPNPGMLGLGNRLMPLGVWGGGSRPGNEKSPNFGVTETGVSCETATKPCHLLLCKRVSETELEGTADFTWPACSWRTVASGRPLTLLGLSSELALPRTPSVRGTRMEIESPELPSASKVGKGGWSLRQTLASATRGWGAGAGNSWDLYSCPSR